MHCSDLINTQNFSLCTNRVTYKDMIFWAQKSHPLIMGNLTAQLCIAAQFTAASHRNSKLRVHVLPVLCLWITFETFFFTISQSEWRDIQLCTMAEKWMKEGRDRNITFTVRFHCPCKRLLTTAKKYSEASKESCFPWHSCLLQPNFGGFQCFVKDIFADRPFVSLRSVTG